VQWRRRVRNVRQDNSESVFSSTRHILEPLLTSKSEINPLHVSSTHQTSYGYFNAGIEIHMVDGTSRTLQHKLVFKAGGAQSRSEPDFKTETDRLVRHVLWEMRLEMVIGMKNENPDRNHETIVLGLFSHKFLKRAIKR